MYMYIMEKQYLINIVDYELETNRTKIVRKKIIPRHTCISIYWKCEINKIFLKDYFLTQNMRLNVMRTPLAHFAPQLSAILQLSFNKCHLEKRKTLVLWNN